MLFDYEQYRELWRYISGKIGVKLEPYDCRRSPSGWLRDLYLSGLTMCQYNAMIGEDIELSGNGWANPMICYTWHGKMNPLAIYDRKDSI
jgi:hypothetical protein